MKESKADIKGDPGNVQLEIGNVTEDLATTQADLERRQQVNELYSQGATNILTFGYQDNADSKIPAVIPFYIDDDVVNVNTCELTFRTKPFRAYSRATEGGGALVKSTGGGGGTVKSTSSGGGTARSTTSGGGTSRSTESGGSSTVTSTTKIFPKEFFQESSAPIHLSAPYEDHTHLVNISGDGRFDHNHSVSIPAHSHEFTVPAHSHEFTVPTHTHNIELPNHTHEIELPNHTHNVKHEIIELDSLPSSVTIKVDGNTVPHSRIEGNRIDLTDYIAKDSDGRIRRGRHELTIQPNGLARIEADLILRVFIQSHLGGTY